MCNCSSKRPTLAEQQAVNGTQSRIYHYTLCNVESYHRKVYSGTIAANISWNARMLGVQYLTSATCGNAPQTLTCAEAEINPLRRSLCRISFLRYLLPKSVHGRKGGVTGLQLVIPLSAWFLSRGLSTNWLRKKAGAGDMHQGKIFFIYDN